jgi:hypothetical protein
MGQDSGMVMTRPIPGSTMSSIVNFVLAACLALSPIASTCAAEPTAAGPQPLTAKQAQRELKILKRALSDLHPGLYRYQTPKQFEAEFARAETEVAKGSDTLQMYLIASRIAAAVRCGHTWTNPLNQGQAVQDALAVLPALPLHVRLLEGRLLVTASADPKVAINAELLTIDGRTPAVLANEFMPYLRADGTSDGKRLSQIDSNVDGGAMDRLLPLLHPPGAGGYKLRFRPHGGRTGQVIGHEINEAIVAGMPVAERERRLIAAGMAPENTDWRFEIDGDTATMTLPTFAFWQSDFDWRGFLQRSFNTLAERKVDKLILDLRQNEGGDDAIGNALQAHLLTEPFVVPAPRVESAYERAPYDLARFMDTWDFSFFDRTGQVVRGEGRNWLLREQPVDNRIEPAAQPYRGHVVLLTGPRMSSAGFLIARNLKASGSATLIGEATGGNLSGLNGGQLAWLVLPTSAVSVDIPLIGSFSKTPQPDRGVLPDIAVRTRLEDVAAGIDPDIVAAKNWLARSGTR